MRIEPAMLVAIVLSRSTAAGAHVTNYCTEGPPWDNGAIPINVYLNENMDDTLCGANGTCTDLADVRYATESIFDELHDSTSATLSFQFSVTSALPGTDFSGAIHIYGLSFAEPECIAGDAVVIYYGDEDGDSKTDQARIGVCPHPGWLQIWDASIQSESYVSWARVLYYSLGGILGFKTCLGVDGYGYWYTKFATMTRHPTLGGYGQSGLHPFKGDIHGLQDQIGLRQKNAQLEWRSTGSWALHTAGEPTGAPHTLSYMSICNSAAGYTTARISHPWESEDPAAGPYDDTRPIRTASYSALTGNWADGSTLAVYTDYHSGTACKSNSDFLIAFLKNYQEGNGNQTIATARYSGGAWTFTEIAATGHEPGINATYDPASGYYILTAIHPMDIRSEPMTYVIASGATYHLVATGNSQSTPSVACGPVSVVGSENCLIAWVDWGWKRGLRWAHGHVADIGNGPELVLGTIYAMDGLHVYGTPSVAYQGTQDSRPWGLLFDSTAPHDYAYYYRKTGVHRSNLGSLWFGASEQCGNLEWLEHRKPNPRIGQG